MITLLYTVTILTSTFYTSSTVTDETRIPVCVTRGNFPTQAHFLHTEPLITSFISKTAPAVEVASNQLT